MRVLFVDDEKIIREGMKEIIDWEGIGCDLLMMADNATRALELMEQEEFDLVITDIYMKKMTGIELAKRIKSFRPRVKVIILSAYEDFSYAREAIEAGVFKYLLKPIVPEELEQAVLEAMEQVQSDLLLQHRMLESEKIATVYRPQLARDFWKALLRREISGREDLEHRLQVAGLVLPDSLCCVLVSIDGREGADYGNDSRVMEQIGSLIFPRWVGCVRQRPGEAAVILSGIPDGKALLDFKRELENGAGLRVRTACGRCVEDPLEFYLSAEDARTILSAGEEQAPEGETLVERSLRLIDSRISEEEFGVNDIAEALHVSAGYFSRLFKSRMRVTCIEYITCKRIEKAKALLEHTDMKHQYIAEAVGYSNVYYFSMQFKKHTGETPGQYRKRVVRNDV